MASDFIPNSYQTPNAYVDRFMAYLTPEEWMVLSYMVRRIFGFNKRQDNIAYSQIMNGLMSKDGIRLDYGTGLGMAATKGAIDALKKFNLVIEVEPNNPHENKGPKYALQLDSELVNTAALIARYEVKQTRNKERMSKARQSITPGSIGQPPVYPIEPPSIYPIEPPPPLLDSGHNIQGNPVLNPDISTTTGKIITEFEAENIYRKVTGFMSMPTLGREDAIRIICDIARVKGDDTADYIKPYYLKYIITRGKSGRVYSKTGYGFLDYAVTETMPQDYQDPPHKTSQNSGGGGRPAKQSKADAAAAAFGVSGGSNGNG